MIITKKENKGNKKVKREEMKDWTYQEKLDYYCNRDDKLSVSTLNGKLGSQICAISLPAVVTCRYNAPCKKNCYCQKGNQAFATVKGSYTKNYRLFQEDPIGFFDKVTHYLKYSGYKYLRWFSAGDCPNMQFFEGIVKVALDNPNVDFMMFTKQYEIVNDYIKLYANVNRAIPPNLKIIFSMWDRSWIVNNPNNFPTAYVSFKDPSRNPTIPETAMECDGHCSTCYKCWYIKENESVVFHQH